MNKPALALLPLLAACASQVPFAEAARETDYTMIEDMRSPKAGVVRVVFDAEGSPFPASKVVELSGLESCDLSLRNYFSANGMEYSAEGTCREIAREVNRQCAAGKTLVILIHGINNKYSEARGTYAVARAMVQETCPSSYVFLEVYWDGLTGNPIGAWGRARQNSKWAGLGLRAILNDLDPSIPTRVLTHSRGAAVISSALWNLPLGENPEADRRFQDRQQALPVPSRPAMRVGLLVPAMDPADFDSCTAAFDRLVLGINEDDPAVGKGLVPASWNSSTLLGCDLGSFEISVRPRFEEGRAFAVDFSGSEEHDFKHYLVRKPSVERFLPLLFGTESLGQAAGR